MILVIRREAEKPLDTPLEDFVKFTEEHRRERERRVDAGDETAKLKFSKSGPFLVDSEPRLRPAPRQQDGNRVGRGLFIRKLLS